MSSRVAVSQTITGVISALIILVIVLAGFVPIAAVGRTSVTTYSTSVVYSSYPINSFTVVQTVSFPTTGSNQFYSLSDYTINCSSSVYQSAELSQGWNLQVSYSAGDTITVYLFNSTGFNSWKGGASPNPVASQTGQSSGTFGYNVPLTDVYYVVWDNNLHGGLFCKGGEKVTVTSSTGIATYAATEFSFTTVTAYSTSTSYSTSYYTISSTTTSTKSVGWICYAFDC